ncbi:MAG: Abi family protein [Bacteroides sp.]|nr:Abi family protein [Eubacterium sp.]MCM1418347.1 Abi family protein [Roseburia sp.]MCM1462829.1 Abi family protein [Bacteroides sp.]
MSQVKRPTTYDEQVKKLTDHGCIIRNEEKCKEALKSVGYYRLSAYFLPFRRSDGSYFPGTDFEKIYQIYEFDRKLRNLIFSAIEVVEVDLRSSLSYYHAHKYGPLGYLNPDHFNQKHNAVKFEEMIKKEIESNKKVLFVKHHIDRYDGQFPLWVACELFTFGMLSYFYNDLHTTDKKALMGVRYKNVASWLRCCTDLRNICAHYGRLYYRVFSAVPAGLQLKDAEGRRLWGAVLALKELYPSANQWNHEFVLSLESLFAQYEHSISLSHMAFPEDWAERLRK